MATEILVNDGGAPARILNFTAAAAISAGEGLKMDTNGEVALTTDNNLPLAGVALLDAAVDEQCSMITGSGVILYMICAAAVNRGDNLMTDEAAPGGLIIWSVADNDLVVAYALEDAPAAGGLTKVLVV